MPAMPIRPPVARVKTRAAGFTGRLAERTQVRLSGRPPITVDGQTLEPEVQLLLATRERLGVPVYDERFSVWANRRFTQAEAMVGGGRPVTVGRVEELAVPGPGGPLRARHYVPPGLSAGAPLLVFLHGGGFVVGDVDTHDSPCRLLCRAGGFHVLSIDYRLAPEHPFPAAQEDSVAAFAWAVEHAAELGADPERVCVGGDSAGGLLSAVVAQAAKAGECPMPALQLLLYPATDATQRRRSYDLFADGFFLTTALIDWYTGHFMPEGSDTADVRRSPLLAEDLSGLAPALVVTAGFDPLRDEGEAYAQALRTAGVPVVARRFDGLIHGFINSAGVLPVCRDAVNEIGGMARSALDLTA
jgi:acetyl esterase